MNLIGDGKPSPLREIGQILLRRRWLMMITFGLTFVLIATVTVRTPKQYRAQMKILVKNDRPVNVISANNNDQSAVGGEVSETQINTEIELLSNTDLLRQVVLACGLAQADVPKNRSGNALDKQSIEIENAVNQLQHDLKIAPAKKADIIDVEYSAGNPQQTAAVLRQLASSYLESHLRLHGTPGTYEFFSNQAAYYKGQLKEAEAKVTKFYLQNNITLFTPQQEELLRSSSESHSMLLAADASVREYTRKIADIRSQLAMAQPRVMTQNHTLSSQNAVDHLTTMLVELQNRRTQLLSKFQPQDRMVQEISQEIADTQASLDRTTHLTGSEQTTDVNPVHQALEVDLTKEEAELAGVVARRQALMQQTENYRLQLQRLSQSNTEYSDLIRGQKEAEDNYLLYSRKAEEARIADSLDKQKIANVVIAENPVVPHYPSKPNVPLQLELGTVFAGLLSLGVAFSTEYLMQPFPRVETDIRPRLDSIISSEQIPLGNIHQASELESLTGLPVLAITKRP